MHRAALLQPPLGLWSPRLPPLRRLCALALATAGGAGLAPVAPGTFGSAVGVAIFFALVPAGALPVGAAALVCTGLGVWAADEAERHFGKKDDGRIVIDEVAGQLVALLPLALLVPVDRVRAPLPMLAGFLLFRGFDIAKPGPVRWAERRFPGGRGVMFDDLVAGVLAASVLLLGLLLVGTGGWRA